MTAAPSTSSILCFVPALHAGYIKFFRKHPGTLYLLDSDFVADFPKLERDLRQTNAEDMKKAISALGIFKEVKVLHIADVSVPNFKFEGLEGELVMPDEDLTRELHAKYFPSLPVVFESIFLRWEKQITTAEHVVPPGRVISVEELDKEGIRAASSEAAKSSDWWRQVGAAIMKDGKVLISGHNRHMPTDMSMDAYGDPRSNFDAGEKIELSTAIHGEASLIAKAAKEGTKLDGTSIYVTTFPCPNCAKLIADAGIKKVFYEKGYSLLDAENILKTAGVEIVMVKMN